MILNIIVYFPPIVHVRKYSIQMKVFFLSNNMNWAPLIRGEIKETGLEEPTLSQCKFNANKQTKRLT